MIVSSPEPIKSLINYKILLILYHDKISMEVRAYSSSGVMRKPLHAIHARLKMHSSFDSRRFHTSTNMALIDAPVDAPEQMFGDQEAFGLAPGQSIYPAKRGPRRPAARRRVARSSRPFFKAISNPSPMKAPGGRMANKAPWKSSPRLNPSP